MKKLTIFTDPHLGTERAAHTTRSSSEELRMSLYYQAMSIVNTAEHPVFCAGDLFDKAQNKESTLVQGFNVASKCWMTLSGNHDELNRAGVVTSLQALKDMGVPICSAPDLSAPYFDHFESIYMVPHHASQELFLQACQQAAEHAAENRDGLASFLFLHCNYDFPMELTDSTLNLPASNAERLLEAFDYIFIGHEHNPSKHLEDRVVILGNCHPTSFSDISDKFIYHLDLETAELEQELVWQKDVQFLELKLGQDIPDLSGVQFVQVVGSEKVDNVLVVNDYLQAIWKASYFKPEGEDGYISQLCAVRNLVEVADQLQNLDTDIEAVTMDSLKDIINKDLEGSDLQPLYQELVAEVTA